jgi:hypothetical protein
LFVSRFFEFLHSKNFAEAVYNSRRLIHSGKRVIGHAVHVEKEVVNHSEHSKTVSHVKQLPTIPFRYEDGKYGNQSHVLENG